MYRLLATLSALTLGCCSLAGASVITPGQTAPPDLLTPSGTTLASKSGSIVATNPITGGTQYTVSYTFSVVADPGNTFCAGCLDFLYTFTNEGPGVNERTSMFNFTGFSVDAGYDPRTTGEVPLSVDRSTDGPLNGGVVGFNFTGADTLTAGETTRTLVVETNATNYQLGTFTVQDGVSVTGIAYAPAAAAPEPASLALFGTGLLGVVGVARRRFHI